MSDSCAYDWSERAVNQPWLPDQAREVLTGLIRHEPHFYPTLGQIGERCDTPRSARSVREWMGWLRDEGIVVKVVRKDARGKEMAPYWRVNWSAVHAWRAPATPTPGQARVRRRLVRHPGPPPRSATTVPRISDPISRSDLSNKTREEDSSLVLDRAAARLLEDVKRGDPEATGAVLHLLTVAMRALTGRQEEDHAEVHQPGPRVLPAPYGADERPPARPSPASCEEVMAKRLTPAEASATPVSGGAPMLLTDLYPQPRTRDDVIARIRLVLDDPEKEEVALDDLFALERSVVKTCLTPKQFVVLDAYAKRAGRDFKKRKSSKALSDGLRLISAAWGDMHRQERGTYTWDLERRFKGADWESKDFGALQRIEHVLVAFVRGVECNEDFEAGDWTANDGERRAAAEILPRAMRGFIREFGGKGFPVTLTKFAEHVAAYLEVASMESGEEAPVAFKPRLVGANFDREAIFRDVAADLDRAERERAERIRQRREGR